MSTRTPADLYAAEEAGWQALSDAAAAVASRDPHAIPTAPSPEDVFREAEGEDGEERRSERRTERRSGLDGAEARRLGHREG